MKTEKIRTALFLALSLFTFALPATAQDEESRATASYTDFMLGIGSGQTNVSLSYQRNWKFGKKQKLEMGVGMRFSSFFSSNKYFTTAPARIVKGEAGPQALFKEPIPEYVDSVLFPSAQINSLNFMLDIAYSFSDRFKVGFNIDVIGISFGGVQSGTYINGNAPDGIVNKPVSGSPTGFNLLLVGENDIGSLNSEFFVAYAFNDTWSAKLGAQHIFMEYTTDTKVQQLPEANDRFRITPTVVCVGVLYRIH